MSTPKGVRSRTKRAGIEALGHACGEVREHIRANTLNMMVVAIVVEPSFPNDKCCGPPLPVTVVFFTMRVLLLGLAHFILEFYTMDARQYITGGSWTVGR
eukprot:426734-Pyramimonas_sp.AAC.1